MKWKNLRQPLQKQLLLTSANKIKKEKTNQTSSTERVNIDTPQFSTSTTSASVETSYSTSSHQVHEPKQEIPIRFVFHKKKAPVNYGHVAGTMIALAILFMGWQRWACSPVIILMPLNLLWFH